MLLKFQSFKIERLQNIDQCKVLDHDWIMIDDLHFLIFSIIFILVIFVTKMWAMPSTIFCTVEM